MKPPAAAAELARAALARLPEAERLRADVPAVIASGADLNDVHLACIVGFWAEARRPDDEGWRLASSLLGGDPMRRAVQAAATAEEAAGLPDPGPHTGAMIAAITDPGDAANLDVPDGLPPGDLHVTVIHLGPAADWDEVDRIDILATVGQVVAGFDGGLAASAGHIAHLGPDRDTGAVSVAYDLNSVSLHQLRSDLAIALRSAGIEFEERFAYRPHMTLTWLTAEEAEADWPEGPLPDGRSTVLAFPQVLVRFGDDFEQAFDVGAGNPSGAPRESPVTAAGGESGLPATEAALDALNSSLQVIHDEAAVAVRTAVEVGWASALNRVGRMATRQADGRRRLSRLTPPAAAVAAGVDALAELNVGQLVAPAVGDTVGAVSRIVAQAQTAAQAAIADAFGVDLTDVWPDPAVAASHLKATLTDELLFRLGVLSDPSRIDPTDGDSDPLLVPYSITRDVLALAGGGVLGPEGVERDTIGRPLANGVAGADSIAFGPAGLAAIDAAITAWVDAPPDPPLRGPLMLAAGARRRAGGNISAELSAELAEAAGRLAPGAESPLERQTVMTWRINANGQAAVNLPRHERMDGVTVTSEAELFSIPEAQADPNDWPGVAVSRPGDHRYCHCAWVTTVRLVPQQQVIPNV